MTIFHLPWWNRQPEVKKTHTDYLQQFHDLLSDEIKRTPPPPSYFCDCDIRYDTFVNRYGERSCVNCRRPDRPIGDLFTNMQQCGITMQQAKERLTMNTCKHGTATGTPCGQCADELLSAARNFPNTSTAGATSADTEITRLQSLLATPNLSQANIDEINQQIGALLVQNRGEKKGEVWLDERT